VLNKSSFSQRMTQVASTGNRCHNPLHMNAPKITTRVTIHLYCNLAPRGFDAAEVGTCMKASLLDGTETYKLALTNLQREKFMKLVRADHGARHGSFLPGRA
jgi:hypothetical protein